jgi:hypothetical protein
MGERRMEEELFVFVNQSNCRHWKYRKFTERSFDIFNGFELVATRCCNCYKVLELKIRKTA